ncbi:MAG TPA: hypothetical protein VKU77_31685 [Streptosporangiaceae bacterium]|nr:hypothetical protein [Streptosporangiaceae bacterium]
MSITQATRPAVVAMRPMDAPPAGSLNGQCFYGTHTGSAVEGLDSPPAIRHAKLILDSPAGSKTSRSHISVDAHTTLAAADDFPGGQVCHDGHYMFAAGDLAPVPAADLSAPKDSALVRDQAPPAAIGTPSPIGETLLADPFLALAADVLDDLEKVRIANENRLRQLTRSAEDSDGEMRGFGLDESHADVARLAALVGMLAEAEHKATLNLQRAMRTHPLGAWVKAQKGIGEKQAARLLASIGDPYMRPEIARGDGTVEQSRPRTVSELWAYCGYHVVPAGLSGFDAHRTLAGGGLNGSNPGQPRLGDHGKLAGVAPKRQRGQHANWSATAKMRTFLVAESCIKQSGTPFRAKYDETRAKYADATHAAECVRCGPKGKPAPIGSALSDGHKHARALRAVAKEILKELWREARRYPFRRVEHDPKPASTYARPGPPAGSGAGVSVPRPACRGLRSRASPASGASAEHRSPTICMTSAAAYSGPVRPVITICLMMTISFSRCGWPPMIASAASQPSMLLGGVISASLAASSLPGPAGRHPAGAMIPAASPGSSSALVPCCVKRREKSVMTAPRCGVSRLPCRGRRPLLRRRRDPLAREQREAGVRAYDPR